METTDLADELVDCVTRIRRLLDTRLQVHGVSVARKRVLGALVDEPVRQSILAARLDLAPRTITEAVDALERDGLVRRSTAPDDRRVRLVHLTPAGRRTDQHASSTRSEVVDEVFAALSADERAELQQLLGRLRRHTTAMTSSSLPPADGPPPERPLPTAPSTRSQRPA